MEQNQNQNQNHRDDTRAAASKRDRSQFARTSGGAGANEGETAARRPAARPAEGSGAETRRPVTRTAEGGSAEVRRPAARPAEGTGAETRRPAARSAEGAGTETRRPATRTAEGGSSEVRRTAARSAESTGTEARRPAARTAESGSTEGRRPAARTAEGSGSEVRRSATAASASGRTAGNSASAAGRQGSTATAGRTSARKAETEEFDLDHYEEEPASRKSKKGSGGGNGGSSWIKTRKRINLIIDLVILVFMVSVVGLTIHHFEKGKGSEDINSGKSYLDQQASNLVKDVEAALKEESRKAEEARRQSMEAESKSEPQTDPGSQTEPATQEPTQKSETESESETPEPTPEPSPTPTPTPAPEIDPQAGTIYAADVVTQKPNYIPWEVDAQANGAAYAQVLANPEYYKVIYDQSLFVGDSVITGVSGYGFIDEGHVLAEVGVSVDHFATVRDQIIAYNPEYVIIRYGLNEIGTTQGDLDWFISTYRGNIAKIKEALPDAKIIVCAITPVTNVAITAQPRMVYIDSYNNALRKMAIEMNVGYTDSANLFHEHQDLYGKDGMHIQKQMYTLWLADMVDRMGIS